MIHRMSFFDHFRTGGPATLSFNFTGRGSAYIFIRGRGLLVFQREGSPESLSSTPVNRVTKVRLVERTQRSSSVMLRSPSHYGWSCDNTVIDASIQMHMRPGDAEYAAGQLGAGVKHSCPSISSAISVRPTRATDIM